MPEYVEFTYEKIVWNIDGSTDDLAVDPTNPDVGSKHTGGAQFVMCDGSVRAEYSNPSSFQIISEGDNRLGDGSGFVGGVTVACGDVNAPGDTFDFKAELTSEPTAPEAGHIKVFSQVDFNATTEPTAAAMGAFDFTRDAKAGGMAPADPELELFCDGSVRPEGQGDPNLLLPAVDDGGYVIDWTPVDPTNPNADLSDGQYVLTGLQHNLPAVQAPADDGLLLV